MSTWNILLLVNYILCIFIVLDMIFVSKKKAERITAWTIFLFIPFLGLFSYLIVGAGLDRFAKQMIKRMQLSTNEYSQHIKNQIKIIKDDQKNVYPAEIKDLILLNLNNSDSIFSRDNDFEYFTDGKSAFENLLTDVRNASSTINLEFYIFENDKTGKTLIKALTEKAKQGVEVRIIYDAIGSFHTHKFDFRKLRKAGGLVTEFFPPFLNIRLLNFKANYRNHRKICVIDGKIGYTGGFNIRADHMGENKRLSPWRDTTIRVVGTAVQSLQNIFLSDFRFAIKDRTKPEKYITEKFFPKQESTNVGVAMQVLSSGPDNSSEAIKECMIKMIVSAKKRIRIQTPYFIPDDTFVGAIKLALLSGVQVELTVPKLVDHWYVHLASFSYINDLLKFGLKVYLYNGFIHSKVVLS